jgi:hypothetical protein
MLKSAWVLGVLSLILAAVPLTMPFRVRIDYTYRPWVDRSVYGSILCMAATVVVCSVSRYKKVEGGRRPLVLAGLSLCLLLYGVVRGLASAI